MDKSVSNTQVLDVTQESPEAKRIRTHLESQVVGQSEPIDQLVAITEKYRSGLYDHSRPIASVLLLGPSGSGKTKLTEAFTEALHGNERHRMKVDCGEYQHSNEIAKLIGSPPGYLGHRETPPLFTNSRIEGFRSKDYPFALLIFDEIEKASDALWHLLLGVLDRGTISNGYNEEVDLTKTVILMTSNAGSKEMADAMNSRLGFFTQGCNGLLRTAGEIRAIGVKAAKKEFTPEFVNRLDALIGCNALTEDQILQVIDIELARLQERIGQHATPRILFEVTDAVREAILEEGFDPKYNARNVRRVIDQRIQTPLGRILAGRQCAEEDVIQIDYINDEYIFTRR